MNARVGAGRVLHSGGVSLADVPVASPERTCSAKSLTQKEPCNKAPFFLGLRFFDRGSKQVENA